MGPWPLVLMKKLTSHRARRTTGHVHSVDLQPRKDMGNDVLRVRSLLFGSVFVIVACGGGSDIIIGDQQSQSESGGSDGSLAGSDGSGHRDTGGSADSGTASGDSGQRMDAASSDG